MEIWEGMEDGIRETPNDCCRGFIHSCRGYQAELSFLDDLGADSLEIFQIIMGIEEEFDIILEDEMIKKIDTIEDVLKLISNS